MSPISKTDAMIDRLPIGILLVDGDAILVMNQMLRSLVGDEISSITGLVSNFPGAAALSKVIPSAPGVWITLSDAILHVDAVPMAGRTLLIMVPLHYMDPKDPQLCELRQMYLDFEEIFQNCFDGIYVADGEGRSLWLNAGFERTYGLSARDFVGRDARELERLGYIKPLITWKVITTKKRQTAVQHTKSGRRVIATGIPLLDNSGKVRKVIINSRDMTDMMALQEKLAEAEADLARTQTQLARLKRKTARATDPTWSSSAMEAVVDLALRLANVDTSVLIHGESGVGKDVIARMIHADGPRANGPFVKINCGAIPGELLESELFGYEGGAFTGARRQGKAGMVELAHKGTLFLDEIGEMPPALQVKLLQVLQDRTVTRVGGGKATKVDFRLVAATNRDLKAMVAERAFREDLYYRLSVVPVEIPPLRSRPEDIVQLAQRFLGEVNELYQLSRRLSGPVMDRMLRHSWPGNVRELRNVVERLVVTAVKDEIDLDALPSGLFGEIPVASIAPSKHGLRETRARHEADIVADAVRQHGSITRAAAHLGISPSTVKRRLRQARGSTTH